MAYRKRAAQSRACPQCHTLFLTAHQSRRYCSSACNTRAWRARQPLPSSTMALTGPTSATVTEAPAPTPSATPVDFAFTGRNLGTLAVGTALGNALTAVVAQVFTAPAKPAPRTFPTWPPAEMLAGAGMPKLVQDPTWSGALWLTPAPYQDHQLYLYVQAEQTHVLWYGPGGQWRVLTGPADLAQLTRHSALELQVRHYSGAVRDTLALAPSLPGEPLRLAPTLGFSLQRGEKLR